ncbi:ATP-binding cassette domain-containing protein [Halomicrobium mukohataei]|uniref:Molybdate/tungstate import ATP-binding protein WtpC n=1 Tax=Halomicrobium mukohataei TaxID=57705 RepID=A0A847UA19_9EURY|nr:ABC transporter ATP-binding protein [Halomicrobium mukohataei]NLV10225.1 ATP-binding cassette domain-containing protein [Halomicrobium mukohataei]
MTAPGVEIEGLTVGYDDVTALDDVSLSVADGEFFTLVGPSGCGKTTTLRSIAGLESPDRGIVSIGGRDVTGEPPEDRETGIVFQNYALFPHMSVRENVAYGLQFRDSPARDDDERVTELLELVEVADLADRDPDQLSGGQQQRVALARALAPEPAVLLLDEPLSALDAQLRQRLRVQIKRIQSELGITTVYVTHDQAEALAISDRVAVLREGRVEQVATPETVYREPATRFVAEFVGDNNVFDGVVTPDGTRATVGDAAIALPAGSDCDRGESVVVAVRPEAIAVGRDSVDTPATERTVSLRATVETVEFLGDAYRVHCEWQGRTLVVKTDADEPPAGDVALRVDPADVRVL